MTASALREPKYEIELKLHLKRNKHDELPLSCILELKYFDFTQSCSEHLMMFQNNSVPAAKILNFGIKIRL